MMELAEERAMPKRARKSAAKPSSLKAALTAVWQSSKFPRSPKTATLSPRWVTIWRRWMSETPSAG